MVSLLLVWWPEIVANAPVVWKFRRAGVASEADRQTTPAWGLPMFEGGAMFGSNGSKAFRSAKFFTTSICRKKNWLSPIIWNFHLATGVQSQLKYSHVVRNSKSKSWKESIQTMSMLDSAMIWLPEAISVTFRKLQNCKLVFPSPFATCWVLPKDRVSDFAESIGRCTFVPHLQEEMSIYNTSRALMIAGVYQTNNLHFRYV